MLSIPERQSVYIADTDDGEGRMLVYHTRLKAWTIYCGIYAEKLLSYGGAPAFICGNALCVFTGDLQRDVEFDEEYAVRSSFTTHFLDFGTPERTKRSVNMVLYCDLASGGVVRFENERGEVSTVQLVGNERCITERISLPRFKKLRVKVESVAPATFSGLTLSAK